MGRSELRVAVRVFPRLLAARSGCPQTRAERSLAFVVGASDAHASAWSAVAGGPSPRPPSTTPSHAAATLRDGSTVHLRPVRGEDEDALLAFLDRLGVNSRRMRFFTGAADLRGAAHWAAAASAEGGVVACEESGEIVGHAAYAPLEDDSAEVAVEVADRLQGLGLGTILVERLAELAETRGIARFVAEVLPENRMMLAVFRDGFDAKVTFDRGTETVEFPTSAWRLARKRFG